MKRKALLPMNLSFFGNDRVQEIESRKTEINQLIERGGLSAEEIDALITEVDGLNGELKVMREKQDKLVKLRSAIAEGKPSEGETIVSRMTMGGKKSEEEDEDIYGTMAYRKAFMNHVLRGTPMPTEYRAGDVTHTTDVGSVIPTPVLNQIIQKMESSGMILPLVTRKAHRGGLQIPTSSVKPVATWVAEGAGSPTQKKLTGEIIFAYHKLRCAVAVTLEVNTMALSVFEATLVSDILEAMVMALEEAIISGTGTGQPSGILKATPVPEQIIKVQKPSYQDLVDAWGAVPSAYERNIRWCMTKKTYAIYFGLQDEVGQPIGRVDHGISNRPERLLMGIPVVICDYIPSFSETLKKDETFAFLFNFRDYVLNTNLEMGIKRRENWDTDDEETKAVMLADGKVVDKNSLVKLVKKAA